MEEVTWFFNSDFEQRLFSNNQTGFHSSRQTQEFEYFIPLIDPTTKIYTTKDYSEEYLSFFKDLSGKELRITNQKKNVHNWCQSFDELEKLRIFQNKIATLTYFKKLGLYQHHLAFISEKENLKPNLLYKDPYNLSGIGHYSFPKDRKKLEKILTSHPIVAEEILNRVKDFSTLFENQKMIGQYENIIDEYYQYKGTIIYPQSLLQKEYAQKYSQALDLIQAYTKDYTGIYSVDSFLYLKNSEVHLQPVCELNMRKTMGYTAIKLKEKYFKHFSCFEFLLKRNSKKVCYTSVNKVFKSQVLMISPYNNLFQVWLVAGNSREEIKDQKKELFSAFF